MKVPSIVVSLVVACVLLLGIALFLLGRLDVASASYESRAVAAYAGALGEGKWLPSALPASAIQIRESHDVDTNEVWFTYSVSDAAALLPLRCVPIKQTALSAPNFDRSTRLAPFVKDAEELLRKPIAVRFYRCSGESYNYDLISDDTNRRVFGWTSGDELRSKP